MKKSILELIALALNGQLEDKTQRSELLPSDEVLGELKSELVPKLLSVAGHITVRDLAQNGPDHGFGVRALITLVQSELIVEYGDKLPGLQDQVYELQVKHDGAKLVVVKVPTSQ